MSSVYTNTEQQVALYRYVIYQVRIQTVLRRIGRPNTYQVNCYGPVITVWYVQCDRSVAVQWTSNNSAKICLCTVKGLESVRDINIVSNE